MKNSKSLKKRISFFLGLIFLLIYFLSGWGWGQENCDLRINDKTNKLEIFIDVTTKSYLVYSEIDSSWHKQDKKIKQWCDIDSLYKTTKNGIFEYQWGMIDLNLVVGFKKMFNFYIEIWERENRKNKKSN